MTSNNPTEQLLEEIYKSARTGMQATRLVAKKTDNEALRSDIEQQYDSYHRFAESAGERLSKNEVLPDDNTPMEKAMLWGSVQLNTLTGASPTKISEIIINGCNMGIVELTKKMNDFKGADEFSTRLGNEFIKNSEEQIERMKQYL